MKNICAIIELIFLVVISNDCFAQEYNIETIGTGRRLTGEYCFVNGKLYHLNKGFITNAKYKEILYAGDNVFAVMNDDGKWGFIDDEGRILIKPQYHSYHGFYYYYGYQGRSWYIPGYFINGKAIVRYDSHFCIIEKSGNVIRKFNRTDIAGLLTDEIIVTYQDGKYGLMTEFEDDITECKYDQVYAVNSNLICVRSKDKKGLVDKHGTILLPVMYDIGSFNCGLARIKKGSKYGYVDTNGQIVIPVQFKKASDFLFGYANTDKGCIDKSGQVIFDDPNSSIACYELHDANTELVAISVNGKCGFVNKESQFAIQPQFDNAYGFDNDYARVYIGQQNNFIDKKGNLIIKAELSRNLYLESCSEGLISALDANLNYQKGYIDTYGNVVIDFVYDDARCFSEGLAGVKKNGLWGYINKKGRMVIEPQYTKVWDFTNGFAQVWKGDLTHIIDHKGKIIYSGVKKFDEIREDGTLLWIGNYGFIDISKINTKSELEAYMQKAMQSYSLPSLSSFVKPKVEREINAWQRKGEFESTKAWNTRVNEQTRKAKIDSLTDRYKKEYECKVSNYKEKYTASLRDFYSIKEREKTKAINIDNLKLSVYDPDNESFMVSGMEEADILLSVNISEAPSFKQNWDSIKRTVKLKYVPDGDDVTLVAVTFTNGQNTYTYDGKSNVKYGITDVKYNFKPLELAMEDDIEFSFDALEGVPKTTVQSLAQNKTKVEHKKVSVGSASDVDTAIPAIAADNNNTFAVIIGNENYQKVSKVECAGNDAMVFSHYCKKTLGMPGKNVRHYADATYATMLAAIDDIKNIAKAYKGGLNVVFYYAGHGIPNESSRDAYLLPVDTDGRNTAVCYPLSKLYQELGSMNAKSVVVFMDACFSGAQRGEGMLASARGVAIKAKPAAPQGNMVVFSAASGDETAYPYKEKNHGLFTYFLLKKLQETKGAVTLGELGSYIMDKVIKESVVSNGKSQTPMVSVSSSYTEDWKNHILRNF